MARSGSTIAAANRRGAFVLGALLAGILLLAAAISIRLYGQLDRAFTVERVLAIAQQQLADIVAVQLDQETGLRGYLSTGQRVFLEPYTTGTERYERAIAVFDITAQQPEFAQLRALIVEMRSVHRSWDREVAQPLIAHPHAKDALERQTDGKVLIDQLRGDTARARRLLASRLAAAQAVLKQRIDETLAIGLLSILIFGGVSIAFVLSRQQMLATIDRERTIVETLQGAFLTDLDPLPGARVGFAYLSSDSDAAVGGDLYDVRRLDGDRGLVIVADISGKGISAAVNTAFVKYSMRTLARANPDPAAILGSFNRMFLESVNDPNLFVVAFVAIVDAPSRSMTYASAGHAGAYLRRGGDVRPLDVTAPIVGIDVPFPEDGRRIQLQEGDLVLLATDGLTEARDSTGATLDDTGAIALFRAAPADPQACADMLVSAVRERNGGAVRDDLAMLVIAFDGTA